MDRSQKLINSFVSETKESKCICITVVIDIIMAMQHIETMLIAIGNVKIRKYEIYILPLLRTVYEVELENKETDLYIYIYMVSQKNVCTL